MSRMIQTILAVLMLSALFLVLPSSGSSAVCLSGDSARVAAPRPPQHHPCGDSKCSGMECKSSCSSSSCTCH